MPGVPRPNPCYLDEFEVWRIVRGRKVWRNAASNRLYTWDSMHGEIEVFDARGRHLGVLHAVTGRFTGDAIHGRVLELD